MDIDSYIPSYLIEEQVIVMFLFDVLVVCVSSRSVSLSSRDRAAKEKQKTYADKIEGCLR